MQTISFYHLPHVSQLLLLDVIEKKSTSTLALPKGVLLDHDREGGVAVRRVGSDLEVRYIGPSARGIDTEDMDVHYRPPESICWVKCPPVDDHRWPSPKMASDSCEQPSRFQQVVGDEHKQLETVIHCTGICTNQYTEK
jgi:hypothetical protein